MLKRRRAYVIDCSYTVRKGKTYIALLLKGKKTVKRYYQYDPYFYADVPESHREQLEMMEAAKKTGELVSPLRVEQVERQIGSEKRKILKIYCKEPSDVPALKNAIPFTCYEYNIPFSRRFMFDMGITPLHIITYEREGPVIKKILSVKAGDPKLDAMAFDIETYNPAGIPRESKDPVIMVSYCGKTKGVITSKPCAHDYVETLEDEKAILERFNEVIKQEDPDVLVGYNSANFDIPYLQARTKATGVHLRMGRFGGQPKPLKKGLINGMRIPGMVHMDLYPIVKLFGFIGIIKTQRFTLDAVAQDVLGSKKVAMKKDEIWQLWDKGDIDRLCEYSLVDSELTKALSDRFLPLEMELSSVAKMPLFETTVSTSGQLVENLLMFHAAERSEMVPSRPGGDAIMERVNAPIQGAFVKLPEPGIYENLAVLDFRGLYPSIIVSYNIDPATLMKDEDEGDCFTSPSGARFRKSATGLIPFVLDYLVDKRMEMKKGLKGLDKDSDEHVRLSARSQALKILANSFYGYMGYARSRWYSRPCAESVTAWGRKHITDTIEVAEKSGFKVLYGDSLPYDRYIIIVDKSGAIDHVKIGDFVRKNKNNPRIRDFRTLSFDGRQVVYRPILRAIEHRYQPDKKGRLLEFVTTHGTTVVTPQHSVYSFDKASGKISLVDAKDLKKGDALVSLTDIPASVVYHAGHEIDLLGLDFGPYSSQLRAYKDELRFPAGQISACPYCGKTCSLYPHISLKHGDRKLPLDKAEDALFIGGANAKAGRIPRFWKLTTELAWIMGYYAAEGSASERNAVHDKAMISFGSQDKKTIMRVKRFFDLILGEDLQMIESFDKRIRKKMFYYRIQRLPIVALFKHGLGLGNRSDGKRVPPIIYSSEEKLRAAFLEGYLEGDGCKWKDPRYRTHAVRFTTKSKELAIGVQFLLKAGRHSTNAFGNQMRHVHWLYRNDKPGIQSLRLQATRKRSADFGSFCLAKIKEIREITDPTDSVFDLEVEGDHNFVDAEGMLLVHNTDSLFLLREGKPKEAISDFMKKVNDSLPEKMELELEGFYTRGVFVSKKGGEERGAKKKYALMGEDGRIKIRGFELVRRDWSAVAKETQLQVLQAILKDGSKEKAVKIIRDIVSDLQSGKVPLQKLAISTQLKKDPRRYEIVSPEVTAAKKLLKAGTPVEQGTIISYVVGKAGKTISEKAEPLDLAKDYDADYYINNQVLPAVMKIMKELGYDEYSMKFGGKQKSLDHFF